MKVVLVAAWQKSWGVTTLARQIAKYADELGHEVHIQDFAQQGFRYPEDPLDRLVTDEFVEEADVAIFVEFAGRAGAKQLIEKYRERGARVVWVPMVEFVFKDRTLYPEIDEVIAVTPLTRDIMRDAGWPAKLVPWSLNPQAYLDPKDKEHSRRPSYLHFARLNQILQSLVMCWGMPADPCKLIVKGKLHYGHDPDEAWWTSEPPPWCQMMVKRELTPTELTKLYDSCDAVMMPTGREGLGLPALEGIARGLYPLYLDGTATQSLLSMVPLPQMPSKRVARPDREFLLDYLVEPDPATIAFFSAQERRPASWTPALRAAQEAMSEWWRFWVKAWGQILDGREAPEFGGG